MTVSEVSADSVSEEPEVPDVMCVECSMTITGDVILMMHNGDPYCNDCMKQCDWCGETASESSIYWVHDDIVCYPCRAYSTFVCGNCHDVFRNGDSGLVGSSRNNAREWCEDCRHTDADFCHECDIYHEEGNTCMGNLINNYSYKPAPIFNQTEYDIDADRKLYMGFELEVECRDANVSVAAQRVIDDFDDLVYLKEDGSLTHGFEIVSHPMTLDFAKSLEMSSLADLIRMGVRSWNTDTCGLHVHVSRAAFTNIAHQYAFTLLLMRNRVLSYVVAGREGSHYARFDKDLRPAIAKWLKAKGDSSKANPPGRYSAVNTQNYATIEVRMFRGSLKRERVLAALEYVHAAVEYSRNAPRGASDASVEYLSAPAFIQWIRTNRERYGELSDYINKSFLGFDKVQDRHNRAVPNDYRNNNEEEM